MRSSSHTVIAIISTPVRRSSCPATCPSSASRRTRRRCATSASTPVRSAPRPRGKGCGSRARTAGTGPGRLAELLAPVSGFVLDDLYVAGDTVWYDGVAEAIDRHRPRVAVVNAGGAEFLEGGLIIMGTDDVREVVARVPTVVAVHLEALNHCFLTRAELRRAVPEVLVPEDGETLELRP